MCVCVCVYGSRVRRKLMSVIAIQQNAFCTQFFLMHLGLRGSLLPTKNQDFLPKKTFILRHIFVRIFLFLFVKFMFFGFSSSSRLKRENEQRSEDIFLVPYRLINILIIQTKLWVFINNFGFCYSIKKREKQHQKFSTTIFIFINIWMSLRLLFSRVFVPSSYAKFALCVQRVYGHR